MRGMIKKESITSLFLWNMRLIAFAEGFFFLILLLSRREVCCCHGFSLSPIYAVAHPRCRQHGNLHHHHVNLFPTRLEDWDHCDVEDWLCEIGFGRYSQDFSEDFDGIGVDGDRLVYLGTEDQLDHIEYQLSLIGVDDDVDQRVLGSMIIELVAASEVTPELLESLARKVPAENRDQKDEGKNEDLGYEKYPDYEI